MMVTRQWVTPLVLGGTSKRTTACLRTSAITIRGTVLFVYRADDGVRRDFRAVSGANQCSRYWGTTPGNAVHAPLPRDPNRSIPRVEP